MSPRVGALFGRAPATAVTAGAADGETGSALSAHAAAVIPSMVTRDATRASARELFGIEVLLPSK
jgi:hypothetical protein